MTLGQNFSVMGVGSGFERFEGAGYAGAAGFDCGGV